MSLIVNGIEIPDTGDITYNGTNIEKIICNGIEVWKRFVGIPAIKPDGHMDWEGCEYTNSAGGFHDYVNLPHGGDFENEYYSSVFSCSLYKEVSIDITTGFADSDHTCYIQYSNDGINWENETSGYRLNINQSYKFARLKVQWYGGTDDGCDTGFVLDVVSVVFS